MEGRILWRNVDGFALSDLCGTVFAAFHKQLLVCSEVTQVLGAVVDEALGDIQGLVVVALKLEQIAERGKGWTVFGFQGHRAPEAHFRWSRAAMLQHEPAEGILSVRAVRNTFGCLAEAALLFVPAAQLPQPVGQ